MNHRTLWLVALALVGCDSGGVPTGKPAIVAQLKPAASPKTSGSEAAQRMARYKEGEEAHPCPVHATGGDVAFEDFTIRYDAPLLAAPETRLPWIRNVEERGALSRRNTKLLIVPYAVKNGAPVARSVPFGASLMTRDGVSHNGWAYNAQLWAAANGRVTDPGRLAPDRWVKSAYLFDVDPAQLESAVLYVAWPDYPRDRNGRTHRVLRHHAVIDLPPATPTDPIRGR